MILFTKQGKVKSNSPLIIIACLFLSLSAWAQNGTIKGIVTDVKTKEALVGVNVYTDLSNGTTTDIDGNYELSVPPGPYKITFKYLGYSELVREGNIKAGQTINFDIKLVPTADQLDIVTVSGSKFERKLTEETVSIEVISNDLIENTNSVTLSDAVDKISGVTIMDGQITIRGGSGYAFGAGSRVLLIYDGLPLLSVDRNEIRWNFIPLEITQQVEVLKSASSALYGAAALNGVVNVRTAWPTSDTAKGEVAAYYNYYAKPRDKSMAWWGTKDDNTYPYRYGGWASYMKRIKRFDLVGSVSYNKSIGYIRTLDIGHRRVSLKMRHRPENIPGLTWGIGANLMESEEADYFFWKGYPDEAYIPYGSDGRNDKGTISAQRRKTVVIDPWVTYYDKFGNRHGLQFRINHVDLRYTANHPHAELYIGQYTFTRKFNFGLTVTSGIQAQMFNLEDQDLGNRQGNNIAPFIQLDQSVGRLNISAGFRYENFNLDGTFHSGQPVGSFGLNYQAGKRSYLRASFGQGFRFPSFIEMFVTQSLTDGIGVFANPDLRPEYGFNIELGFKQGFKLNQFLGYFDAALFWMEYWDMTEFVFGFYPPSPLPPGASPIDYAGFQSQNTARARIAGFELSYYAEGKVSKNLTIRTQGGYTYNYPVDLSEDNGVETIGDYMKLFFQSIGSNSEDIIDPMLRFRTRHTVKTDVEFDVKHMLFGADIRYYSYVEKIDAIFDAFIPGLTEFRETRTKGEVWFNVRAGYNTGKYGQFSVIVNNALNRAVSIRPARMDPPLNVVFQYKVNI